MNILVIGGTGTVGSQIVTELQNRNADITVLTRNEERPSGLSENAGYVTGDLLDPKSVNTVFDDIDAVFLLNPVSTTETHQGLIAVNEAQKAGVQRIVYLSVQNADNVAHVPHFGSKLPVEAAIKESGISYTILRPNSFFQNDLWLKEPMIEYDVYPNPIGSTGVSRVDVRDIAEVAVTALTGDDYNGETITIAGPEALTGPRCAEIWSDALSKTVHYSGNDLDAWEKEAVKQMPSWMVYDLKLMLQHFQDYGLMASDKEIDQLTDLLGHPPRSFEDFASETAKQWRK